MPEKQDAVIFLNEKDYKGRKYFFANVNIFANFGQTKDGRNYAKISFTKPRPNKQYQKDYNPLTGAKTPVKSQEPHPTDDDHNWNPGQEEIPF